MTRQDQLTFDIKLLEATNGWAEITISSGQQRISAICSNLLDTLGDIIRGLTSIAASGGKFSVECESESAGVVLLTLRRVEDRLELTAKKDWQHPAGENARHQRARLRHRGAWPGRPGHHRGRLPAHARSSWSERLRAALGACVSGGTNRATEGHVGTPTSVTAGRHVLTPSPIARSAPDNHAA